MLSSFSFFYHFFCIISSWLKTLNYEWRLRFFSNFFCFSKCFINDLFLSDLFEFLWEFLKIEIFFKFLIKFKSFVSFVSFGKLEEDSSFCSFINFIVEQVLIHEISEWMNKKLSLLSNCIIKWSVIKNKIFLY